MLSVAKQVKVNGKPRDTRVRTHCRKCNVHLCVGECFEAFHTRVKYKTWKQIFTLLHRNKSTSLFHSLYTIMTFFMLLHHRQAYHVCC